MSGFSKINWLVYCILIYVFSRLIMLYQYDLANDILIHHHTEFFQTMCKWDCKWYLTIVQNGYDDHLRTAPKIWKGLANWAFFPLYPYLVRFIANLSGLTPVMTGGILNQIFIFIALIVFYKYLRLFVDDHNARFGVLLLAVSPFSIYFISLYTEALFLLLSLIAFYLMRINKPFISAIFGGLLSATRPVGVMFSISYFLYQIRHSKKLSFKIILYSFVAILGLACYMLYLQVHTGDFLAFKHVQSGWGRHGFDTHHIRQQLWEMLSDTHNSVMFLLSVGLTIYLFLKGYFEEAIFNLSCILPGALTGTMLSEARFSGTLFTLYLGITLICRKSNSLKIIVAALFFLLYISYLLYWLAKAKFLI